MEKNNHISVEQQRYATLLKWGANTGLLVSAVSFLSYVFGVLPARIPLQQMPQVWSMPVHEYLQQTHAPTGWNWLALVGNGDFTSLIGIAILSGCSLLCLLAVIPLYVKRGDWIFVLLCVFAMAVQVLAASGILGVGH